MDTSINLQEIVKKHGKWLRDEEGGAQWVCPVDADLSRADLRSANLRSANLRSANLSDANLSGADLSGANLSGANLSDANLSRADLSCANLRSANLSDANLSGANLSDANLSGANLSDANLSRADLSCANLRSANLRSANLRSANLSHAKNLLNPIKWMSENFEHDDLGFIVYKGIGDTSYEVPGYWTVEPGSFLEEIVNPLPVNDCGCGVNFAPISWIRQHYSNSIIWRCRIRWMDCVGVVVPYNTDGKARCSRLELIEIVK